ncbi:basic proline-rich protein-like [Neopsephotus bourkii]|uniref:basic proline-rich protein-like n=1 Tax=Neopsephotus bourkii TaxID=309878 RepID=UPI002AA5BFA3|nr:basic proline-rich protein-like [Neopsephotus bourkii]
MPGPATAHYEARPAQGMDYIRGSNTSPQPPPFLWPGPRRLRHREGEALRGSGSGTPSPSAIPLVPVTGRALQGRCPGQGDLGRPRRHGDEQGRAQQRPAPHTQPARQQCSPPVSPQSLCPGWYVPKRGAGWEARRVSYCRDGGKGVTVTGARREAYAARPGGGGAASLPATRPAAAPPPRSVPRGSRTAPLPPPLLPPPPPPPPHFRAGRGHTATRRAASIRDFPRGPALSPAAPGAGLASGSWGWGC